MVKVLGIDIASAEWSSNGSAVITFDAPSRTFRSVQPAAIEWPTADLTAQNLANAINSYAREHAICAVALDGPQGWRDPSTAEGTPGVGRRCEYECRTQAKTGVYPLTFPGNQRPWIEFCVDVFAELLAKDGVRLADPAAPRSATDAGYTLLECNPTSAWRTSGLTPLPGKSKKPLLEPYFVSLAGAYALPRPAATVRSHDDLQAIVAAIVAAAAVGGPALAISTGVASALSDDGSDVRRRLEGFIWNIRPLTGIERQHRRPEPLQGNLPVANSRNGGQARVTQRVIDQISRAGVSQSQITLRNVPGGTKTKPVRVAFTLVGASDEEYCVIVGDTNAAWWSHQDTTTRPLFERLFALLADRPDEWQPISLAAA